MPTFVAFNRDESLPVASRCWGMRGDEDRTAGRVIEGSGGGEDKMARVLGGPLGGLRCTMWRGRRAKQRAFS